MDNIQAQESTVPNTGELLGTCRDLLEKLSSTCCMKVRSVSMSGLIKEFDGLESMFSEQPDDHEILDEGIEKVIDLGARIGALHVSCCTKTRERLYQKLLNSLNQVHNNFWALKGVSH